MRSAGNGAVAQLKSARSASQVLSIVGVVGILASSIKFHSGSIVEDASVIQQLLIFAAVMYWGHITIKINKMTPAEEENDKKRLQEALANPGNTGLTEEWYTNMSTKIQQSQAASGITLMSTCCAAVLFGVYSQTSAFEALRIVLSAVWTRVQSCCSHIILFAGIFVLHFVSFWGACACYMALDFIRPSWVMPFKAQEDAPPAPLKDVLVCCLVALGNQVVLAICLVAIWFAFPVVASDAFDKELPSLATMLIHLGVHVWVAEILFWTSHRILHTPWMFKNVHHVHHQWKTPIAPCAIYAHPLEFIMGNVVVMAAGPLLMGSHITVWWLWATLATINTVGGHSGWHIPGLGAHEAHNFHHIQGWDNMGVLNVMDTFFGTNERFLAAWNSDVEVNYSGPQYPVEKILAREAARQREQTEEKFIKCEIVHQQDPSSLKVELSPP